MGSLSGSQYPLYFARGEYIVWIAGERFVVLNETGALSSLGFVVQAHALFLGPCDEYLKCVPCFFVLWVVFERPLEAPFGKLHLTLDQEQHADEQVGLASDPLNHDVMLVRRWYDEWG